MDKIILRRANVVKEVASEEAAVALERKGFIRDGVVQEGTGGTADAALQKQVEEQKEQLINASKAVEAAESETNKYAEKLKEAEEKLAEASKYAEETDKKINDLEQELSGTKEQLEAAVKKNAAAKKEK